MVELPELEPLEPEPMLPLPLELPAPDLLKWASHSEREIWPSLFVSTAEKFGAEALLALLPDMPALDDEGDVPALPPEAAGEDEDLSLLVLDEELCARATLDSANRAAALAALRIFRFNMP